MSNQVDPQDPRIWRVVADPLVAGAATGPLKGETVAVKDVFAVAGQSIGAGNPAWLADAKTEPGHAAAVAELLAAGANVVGIAHTDEFAYSLDGTNTHYGTPPSRAGRDRISGGSSSGSASAVAWDLASIGLGTDTGGSIRIPAAYQGLYSLRSTYNVISRSGVLPLAPSFDAIGWLTRDSHTLSAVGDVLLPSAEPNDAYRLVVVPELLELADREVADAVGQFANTHGAAQRNWPGISVDELGDFVLVQAFEAWRELGPWLTDRLDTLGPGIRSRFEMAARVRSEDAAVARDVLVAVKVRLLDWLADDILVLPAAPSVAPRFGEDSYRTRVQVQRLSVIAGIAGLPALTVPVATRSGLNAGVCLLAAPGRDRDLLRLVESLT